MVMAQSLFAALRRQYPDAVIDVLAPRWTLPLLAFMPEIQMPSNNRWAMVSLSLPRGIGWASSFGPPGTDLALVLPGSMKAGLVPYWADIPRRRGYGGTLRGLLLNDVRRKDPLPQIEATWLSPIGPSRARTPSVGSFRRKPIRRLPRSACRSRGGRCWRWHPVPNTARQALARPPFCCRRGSEAERWLAGLVVRLAG